MALCVLGVQVQLSQARQGIKWETATSLKRNAITTLQILDCGHFGLGKREYNEQKCSGEGRNRRQRWEEERGWQITEK